MKRAKIGSIIEIETKVGLAYAMYTHKNEMFGALIRVFNTIYQERPKDFNEVALDKIRFSIFFPLNAALNRSIFEVVDIVEVPDELKEFPMFRSGNANPKTKKVKVWWLWDGEKSWKVGELTNEQKKYSIRGVCTDLYLIRLIETGWTPETDPTTE